MTDDGGELDFVEVELPLSGRQAMVFEDGYGGVEIRIVDDRPAVQTKARTAIRCGQCPALVPFLWAEEHAASHSKAEGVAKHTRRHRRRRMPVRVQRIRPVLAPELSPPSTHPDAGTPITEADIKDWLSQMDIPE